MEEKQLNIILDELQKNIKLLYDEYGLTEDILDLQTTVNKIRHRHNISDSKKELHEGYVQ